MKTKAEIRGMLERLNGLTNGAYKLGHDGQGWQLRRIVDVSSGAESDIGVPSTNSEVYYTLFTICRLLEAEKWLIENAPHLSLRFPK